ncbi:MAG: ORF6N domain-containing protein [candidate division Zixibacteria bacterium]|nr:ORF6N domain-containing protein [candidate division Zixibacteria bacterium]
MQEIVPQERIESKIFLIRGQNVILDRHIAALYGVKPIALRQQVKRNMDRFPEDFMLKLTKEEAEILLSQNVIPSKRSLGGYLPYAFTEQGVAMLSSVLNSKRAIYVNIQIMRTFAKLRQILLTHADLKRKIEGMEKKYDQQFKVVFEVISKLLEPPKKLKKKIGFRVD